jgi:hypothetical protein
MSPKPKARSFASLLDRWPNLIDLARDLNLSQFTVRAWRRRDAIPARYWDILASNARGRGLRGVTYASFRDIEAGREALRQTQKAGENRVSPPTPSRGGTLSAKRTIAQDAQPVTRTPRL